MDILRWKFDWEFFQSNLLKLVAKVVVKLVVKLIIKFDGCVGTPKYIYWEFFQSLVKLVVKLA